MRAWRGQTPTEGNGRWDRCWGFSVLGRTGATGARRGKEVGISGFAPLGPSLPSCMLLPREGELTLSPVSGCQNTEASGICLCCGAAAAGAVPVSPMERLHGPCPCGGTAQGRRGQPGAPICRLPWGAKGLGTSLGLSMGRGLGGRGVFVLAASTVGYRGTTPHPPHARCPPALALCSPRPDVVRLSMRCQ